MYHKFFIHSYVNEHLDYFHVHDTVNSAEMKNDIHGVLFWILIYSVYMTGSGIAGSYGGFIPRFLQNFHNVFHSGCINVY